MIRSIEVYIDNKRLDLFSEETISITSKIQDVKDIGSIFTDYSQEFNVPASVDNNKTFKHYYNFEINESSSFDARIKIDALIKLNGVDFRKGKAQLNSVSMKDGVPNAYQIIFYGETIKLKDIIGEAMLEDLDLSAYNHNYNITNAYNGLQTSLFSGNIVYPLISHSENPYFYNSSGVSEDNLYSTGGSNTYGVTYTHLKPAIKLYALIKSIESKYSISFSDDFFGTSVFTGLYMWLHREKGTITAGVNTQTKKIGSGNWTYSSGVNILSQTPLIVFKENFKNYRKFTFEFTVTPVETGLYNVEVRNEIDNSLIFSQNNVSGTKVFSVDFEASTGESKEIAPSLTITTKGGITNFTPSLVVTREFESNTEYSLDVGNYANVQTSIVSEIFISDTMPKMKILDFLTGIFKMFNLTAYVNDSGVIVVKPLKSFYKEGNTYDITKYIDASKHNVNRLPSYREIYFKHNKAVTYLTITRNEIVKEEFGNLSYKGRDIFDNSTYSITSGFEHVMYERMNDANNLALTEIQWGWFVDDKVKSTVGSPLVFYNVNTSCATNQIAFKGTNSVTTYNRPSNVTSNSLQTINFGAEIDEYTRETNLNSLFESYYDTYINKIYSYNSRLFNYECVLPLSILLKYKLNDYFLINGRRFSINSIETNLNTGKTTLELVNEIDIVDIFAPSQPTNLAVGTATAYTLPLTWTASTDNIAVVSYNVYLNGLLYANSTTNSYTLTGLTSSTTYNINVSALDDTGNESILSATVVGTTISSADVTAPSVPTGLTLVTKTDTTVNFSWTASTDNVAVAGYKVYKDSVYLATVTSGLTYTATGLTASTAYAFTVLAYDTSSNQSAQSTALNVTTNAPSDTEAPTTPTGLYKVYELTTSVKFGWTASTDNVAVTGYKIYKNNSYLAITTSLEYIATGLTSGTSYDFRVSAIDAASNESALSSILTMTTG